MHVVTIVLPAQPLSRTYACVFDIYTLHFILSHSLFVVLPSTLLWYVPVARDVTSQHDTDEGGIVGNVGGTISKLDVTDRDSDDVRANTSAEHKEDDDDHTSSQSQYSSRHVVCSCMYMHG